MKNKFYAYVIPRTGELGVFDNWPDCERKVSGVAGARFRGFKTEADARMWLKAGADYEIKNKPRLKPGIYFDAGTGRGNGVEVSVTDGIGRNLLYLVLPKAKLNKFGKHLIHSKAATNNYGELLAAKYALEIALKKRIKKVFGDSALILNFWSKGIVRGKMLQKTKILVREVKTLRKKFEKSGGRIAFISGDSNPADLGFH